MTRSIWSFLLVPKAYRWEGGWYEWPSVELLSELKGKADRRIWTLGVKGALHLVCSGVPPVHFPIPGISWDQHN